MLESADAMKLEEYNFLRAELNENRKYIFERPLLIIGATLAAAISLSAAARLGLLPFVFLMVLLFNLWFTFNRMESSSRIIAYLQLVHEGRSEYKWIGWENALRVYRTWVVENKNTMRTLLRPDPPIPQYHHMAYYAPIFYFHLALGFAVTTTLLATATAGQHLYLGPLTIPDDKLLALNWIGLCLFATSFLFFRPKKVRHAIEFRRQIWQRALEPAKQGASSSS